MSETPRDPQTLEVVRLGHPVLRKVAEPVPESLFGTGELNGLCTNLLHTMFEEQGVGLAAPQVAEPLRLFSYWVPGSEEEPEIEPAVLVNPVLKPVGEHLEEGWEGCLSIPGLRGVVPRFTRIKVKAQTTGGAPVSFTADGFHARVIQHEFDHLDGVVYLDRMTSMESLAYDDELERRLASDEERE